MSEHRSTFGCFGSECTVIVASERDDSGAADAVALAKRRLREWHRSFSRFEPASELSQLNADPRAMVPISPMMGRVLGAALAAAERTEGLVDATLVREIELAGYARDLETAPVPLAQALALAPERAPAGPRSTTAWRGVVVDRRAGTVTRPPGLRFDSGGIAKGVFADELAVLCSNYDAFAIDCAGDIRLGGRAGTLREVHVASPFDGSTLHTLTLARGAVATSGVGKRSWIGEDGRPRHHLLDPATGSPAFTGVVQVTALAPTATLAEVASKAALLSGPERAARWLPDGGVVVLDDRTHRVVTPQLRSARPATDRDRRARAPVRAH